MRYTQLSLLICRPQPPLPFSFFPRRFFFLHRKKNNSKSNNKFKLISRCRRRRRRHQSAAIGFWPAEFPAVTLLLMCPPTLRDKAIIRPRYQSHRGHAFTRFVDFRHRRTVPVPSGHTILYHIILRTVVASPR